MSAAERLSPHLSGGARVAIGDGAGAPVELAHALPDAAAEVGGVSLLLGWCFAPPLELPHAAFVDVRAIMGGYGLRGAIRNGSVRYVPAPYGVLRGLLRGPLRPEILLTSLVPVDGGLSFATEVGWQQVAVDAGARVLAEVNHGLPRAASAPPLPPEQVVVVRETDRLPLELAGSPPDATALEIGRRVAQLLPEGATLELAPGSIGEAVLVALEVPVRLHTGVVGDGVRRLDERGLLLEQPCASYVGGTAELYEWADGRPIASAIERTHGAASLAARSAFFAINTGVEIDEVGNVNAQGVGDDVFGGVGGLPDFAFAASRSPDGLSVVALPSERKGRSTLVEQLSAPASLGRSDVDVVVTERGGADLRGLSDAERRTALRDLWRGAQ